MREIFCSFIAFFIVAGIASAQPDVAQRRRLDSMMQRDGIYRLDTCRLSIAVGGRDYSARVVAYVTGGELFIEGRWQNDPTARVGTESILSFCLLRVPAMLGDHRIIVDTSQGRSSSTGGYRYDRQTDTAHATMFWALFTGPRAGKAFTIYKSDYDGGSGSVNVTSVNDDLIRGTFTISALNKENRADVREVTGTFEVPFRRWMEDYWVAQR